MSLLNISGQKKIDLTIVLIMAIIAMRLVFIFIMGPMPQDAYYFFYSQHPALSYFDHPPMIAYLLRLFTQLFGNSIMIIKLADSSVTLITTLLFYKLSKCFLGQRQLSKALLLMLSTMMVTVLSLVSTPDTPLLMCWTLSLYLLYQALFKNKNVYLLWAGIAMGLAFDSKYTGIFLPAGLVLYLLLSGTWRVKIASIWFWLAVLFFFLVISPVVIWNAENNFASFKFQATSRINSQSGVHFQIKYFLGLIGHQSLILMPILFVTLIYLLIRLFKKYKINFPRISPENLFLLCFFLPLFFCFTLLSFVTWIKLNWLMPAYITGIIWASIYIPRKWVNYQVILSFIIHILLAIEVIFYPFPIKSDDTWYGWEDLSSQVIKLKKTYPNAFVFSADGYKTSAELNLLMDDFTYAQNVIGENALEFDYIKTDLSKLQGKDALFIDSQPNFKNENKENRPVPQLLHYFKSVEELKPIIIRKNGRPVRKFLIYYCRQYHL